MTALVRITHSEESDVESVTPELRTQLTRSAKEWLFKSVPEQTFFAYQREWYKFIDWCRTRDVCHLPVFSDHLTNWVASRCDAGDSQSAIKQGISAVVFFHDQYKKAKPDRRDAWRVLAAYRRQLIDSGWRPDEAATYTIKQLRAMTATLPDTSLGIRDKAGLLVATGAFARRSQLVGLDIGDIRFTRGKIVLFIARSKEDQAARGRSVVIDPGAHPDSDAVGALRDWVDVLDSWGIRSGPLFRRMWRTSPGRYTIKGDRLDGEWLGRVVKTAISEAGITAPSGRTYRAHSTRASGATMAFRKRKPSVAIARQGGWSEKGTQHHTYNRPEDQESVTEGLM